MKSKEQLLEQLLKDQESLKTADVFGYLCYIDLSEEESQQRIKNNEAIIQW
jgi:hypothetical protein